MACLPASMDTLPAMTRPPLFSYVTLAVLVTGTLAGALPTGAQVTDFQPRDQHRLNNPDPEDWLMWRGGYRNWGYSPLAKIDRDNVDRLQLAWSWSLAPGTPGSNGMQVEPTVYDGVMYLHHADE